FVNPSATAVWPPTGIALAALLLVGVDLWPAVFAGALLVNLTTAGSMAASAGIATGNTIEAVVGALLLTRFAGGASAVDRPPDLFKLALLTLFVSTPLSATIGSLSLAATGLAGASDLGSFWMTWWLVDAVCSWWCGTLLLSWSHGSRVHWTRRRAAEAALLGAVLLIVANLVFGGWNSGAGRQLP